MQTNLLKNANKDAFSPEKAKWITHPLVREETLEYKKSFAVRDVQRARLFICGLGFFDFSINGRSIDESFFKPIVTDYEKRDLKKNKWLVIGKEQTVCAHVYDVTRFLAEGENSLSVFVGDGYYHNEEKVNEPYASYGNKKLIFELRIETAAGCAVIASDEDTLVRYTATRSFLFGGEYVDFSKEAEPFSCAVKAVPVGGTWRVLTDADNRLTDIADEEFPPVAVRENGKSRIYDFGKNRSGSVAFTVRGARGRELKIRFAEVLHEDGSLNMETSRWESYDEKGERAALIDQTCTYVLSGGRDEIKPAFSWRCYRYAEIEDAQGLEIENMRAVFIHMNIEKSGTFCCGEKIFNDLHEATRLSVLDNLHAGLFTDCPHREKRPYTGDGQVMAETLLYDLDAVPFLDKWLWDIVNAQGENGNVPNSAPHMNGGGGYFWGYAVAEVPERLYAFTGNLEYIQRAYEPIKKWLGYFKAHSIGGVVSSKEEGWYLGDWLAPEITEFNIPFMSTLCYYRSACVAERFARLLHKAEADEFAKLKEDVRTAINEKFFDKKKCRYCNGIQGENVLPLAFGIVPKEYEEKVRANVRDTYERENNYHFDTGIVATPVLLEYLTNNGMEDIAYALMTQKDCPSYAYMLDGETTLSEHWTKRWPDYHIDTTDTIVKGGGHLSHCHHMFGSVTAWLYKYVAGIDCSRACDGVLRFAPKFIDKLPYARASVKTRFGKASVCWENRNGLQAELVVPHGAIGELSCKSDEALLLEKGTEKRTLIPKEGVVCVSLSAGTWKIRSTENK